MLLLIDNYDSFTFNLAQYFQRLGLTVKVVRNDAITPAQITQLNPDYIVISPGPCSPDEAGVSQQVVAHFSGKIPLLGICLGHQTIAQVFGAKVVRAQTVMHGKTSKIRHTGEGVFRALNNPLTVCRYHSLVVDPGTLSDDFIVTAWATRDDNSQEIMAIKHRTLAIEGVQFHPEAILTEQGLALLANFIEDYAPKQGATTKAS